MPLKDSLMRIVLLILFFSFNTFAQDDSPFEVKLYSIDASKEGAYTSKWEKLGEGQTRTNKIFIKNLPSSVATGDDWSGKLQRNGAFTLEDGTRIPEYLVADSPLAQVNHSGKNQGVSSISASGESSTPTTQGDEEIFSMQDADRGIFVVEVGKSSGTGFLLKMDGAVYFVSNIHVFQDEEKAIIKNSFGNVIEVPSKVELAEGLDLFRFKTEEKKGFELGKAPSIGELIFALGNSDGGAVITKNRGDVLGLGESNFEVSAEIVPGNSGGPIMDKSGKVYGVASFATYGRDALATEGTRYAKTRRFGIRIDRPIKWEIADYEIFRKEAVYINSINASLQAVLDCWQSIDSKKAMITFKVSENLANPERAQRKLDNIVRYHNKEYANYYGTKSVKEMIGYMNTQLKEATQVIIEDNRTFLKTHWAKAEYEKCKDWASRLSGKIAELRDSVRKSF